METKFKFESLYQILNKIVHNTNLHEEKSRGSLEGNKEITELKRTWLELSLILAQCSPLLSNFYVSQTHLLLHNNFQNIPIFSSLSSNKHSVPLLTNRAIESKLRILLIGVLTHFSGQAINSESDISNASEALLTSLKQGQPSLVSSAPPILPFFKDALEYLQLFLELIEKYDALLQFSETHLEYYQTLIHVSLLKLQVLFESELFQVFHPDVIKLCETIEMKLHHRRNEMENKLRASQKKLNAYALGPDFQRQVQELIQIRKEIENSRSETMWF
ncbi:hypothetical protein HMI54_004833 [Coelomomyces lativittatus]|nr:hypothetical protein HMI54_004833 [Coelomomyces lativittatus]KAJ1508066.1 hypothetical protein HMI55_000528 [Coelomomyces lativittatus]KAJ1515924.1 hypothetical protein HMI56_006150 [Coelomomyces lativittatus]